MRSLIPRGVNVMALTPTANRNTRRGTIQSLCMETAALCSKILLSHVSCMKSSQKQL